MAIRGPLKIRPANIPIPRRHLLMMRQIRSAVSGDRQNPSRMRKARPPSSPSRGSKLKRDCRNRQTARAGKDRARGSTSKLPRGPANMHNRSFPGDIVDASRTAPPGPRRKTSILPPISRTAEMCNSSWIPAARSHAPSHFRGSIKRAKARKMMGHGFRKLRVFRTLDHRFTKGKKCLAERGAVPDLLFHQVQSLGSHGPVSG